MTAEPSKSLQDSSRQSSNDLSCSEHPIVSIVLCTNRLRTTLDLCLKTLAAQRCHNCETLLVLNGRADQRFERAVSEFPVLLLNEPRQGVSNARNTAVRHARGDILAFVDDDISVDPHWLHELVRGFNDPRTACVTGRVIPQGPPYVDSERIERFYWSKRALSEWVLDPSDPGWYQAILETPVGFGCNMAFRKSFLHEYSLFPTDLGAGSAIGCCDEFYMFLKVLKHGFRLRHIPSAAAKHYFDPDAETQKQRSRDLCAGAVAFALKLMVDEKGLRGQTVKWFFRALGRRTQRALKIKRMASEPEGLLSWTEKVGAYLRGVWVFQKSRRRLGPL